MIPRRRVDQNQAEIVAALRAIGATVLSLAPIGKGAPDLVVGYKGCNFLIEVKNPKKPKADRQLTADEVEWIDSWRGQVAVVETVEAALALVMGRG